MTTTVDMLAKMKNRRAAQGIAPAAAPPAPEAIAKPPYSPNVLGIVTPVPPTQAAPAPAPTPGVTYNQSYTDAAPPLAPTPPEGAFAGPAPLPINPPESALPPAPPVGSVEAAPAAAKKGRGPNKPKAPAADADASIPFEIHPEVALAMAELATEIAAAFTKYATAVSK